MHHLVGSAEVADMLGVSRQRVQQLIAEPDWPEPEVSLKMGKVWRRDAIRSWAEQHGRTISGEPAGE